MKSGMFNKLGEDTLLESKLNLVGHGSASIMILILQKNDNKNRAKKLLIDCRNRNRSKAVHHCMTDHGI